MTPLRRLPYPRRSRLAFPIVIFAALAAVLAVVLLASTIASAAPAPAGGPRLGGAAAADGTLIGAFTFGPDGQAVWLSEIDTLRTSSIFFLVYNPNLRHESGMVDLTFRWEKSETVLKQVMVNGSLETTSETVWNTTDQRTFQVSAPYRNVDFTEIEVPRKEGERLTILYEGQGRELRVGQLTHHTSPLYAKQPRVDLQTAWITALKLLGMALVAAGLGVMLSRWAYVKAGRHVPEVTGGMWALTVVVLGGVFFMLWQQNREGLVLNGSIPPLAVFGLLVAFHTMQVWRDEPDAYLFVRIHDDVGAAQPTFSSWRRYIPKGDDPHPLTEDPRHVRYIDDNWRAFAWRVFLGGRTYLELPESHRWNYIADRGPFERLYVLDGDKNFETVEKQRIEIFPPDATWRPSSWLRVHRRGITSVPVSPWAQHLTTVRVLANLKGQQAVGKEHQDLLVRNAELEAALKSGLVTGTRRMMDRFLLAQRASRTGKEFQVTLDEHEDMKRATDPALVVGRTHNGGQAGAAATQNAAPAPASANTQGGGA